MEMPEDIAATVVGAGVDVVDVARFGRLVSTGETFTRRWFTPIERAQSEDRCRPEAAYAARFAVKEAVWKTLGVESWHRPIVWRSIEVVVVSGSTDVTVILHDEAAAEALRAGVCRVRATVSVARGVATAFATAIRATAIPRSPRQAE